jgi:hypothetical protein
VEEALNTWNEWNGTNGMERMKWNEWNGTNEKRNITFFHLLVHLLVHGLEKRVLSVQVVVLAGAHIHVSMSVGAVLCGEPVVTPVISVDLRNIIAQNHDVVAVQSCIFFARCVVMGNGLEVAGSHALEPVPRSNVVCGVHVCLSNHKKTDRAVFNFL